MTVFELLKLVEKHPFILLYYAFSMILSIVLGKLFLAKLGHPKVWNYFFSLLIYVMSVFGVFSFILFFYQVFTRELSLSAFEILIPFATMVVSLLIIFKQVNVSLLTGFQNFGTFLLMLFLILLACILVDYFGWLAISHWPVYLFFLFLIVVAIVVHQFKVKRNVIWRV